MLLLTKNCKLLFTGDSITDCGRGHEITPHQDLGNGYVNLVNSSLRAGYPDLHCQIINTGISGNRVTDLKKRWQEDVLDHQAEYLSIMIGINDVWRQFDQEFQTVQVTPEIFEATYRDLIEKSQDLHKGIILGTPYYLETDKHDPMRQLMDRYGSIVKRLAGEYKTELVDTQLAFDIYMQHNASSTLCEDKVHPNQIGHMILAKAFLKVLESK